MKKRVYIFLILLIVILGLYWFFIVKKSAVNNDIPNYADAIICIDKQNIRNSVLSYFLSNPSEYFSKKDSTKASLGNLGIEVPSYLVLFSANTVSKGTFFTKLQYKNKQFLTEFLLSNDFYRTTQKGYEIYERDAKIKIKAYFKEGETNVVLAGNLIDLDSNTIKVVNDLFNENNLLSKDDGVYNKLKSSSNHITVVINKNKYIKKQSLVALNFLKGKVEVNGEVYNRDEYKFKGEATPINLENGIFNISANFDNKILPELINEIDKTNFQKKTNLNIDSLNQDLDERIIFQLNGIKKIYDTSISYGYDENFNIKEKKIIDTINKPNFKLFLGVNNHGGLNYLLNDSILKSIDRRYVLVAYPLQRIFCFPIKKDLLFSDDDWSKDRGMSLYTIQPYDSNRDDFFSLRLNFKQMQDVVSYNISDLNFFTLHLTQKQSVEVKGELRFMNEDSHTIFSVLNMFMQ